LRIMSYYVNLAAISLARFKELLNSTDLVPSRMVLRGNIDRNFHSLSELNIHNAEELMKALGSKKKLHLTSVKADIDEEYLTILLRELKGYRKKPISIKDFPGLPGGLAEKLESLGLKKAHQLYDQVLTRELRASLAQKASVSHDDLLRLTRMVDLSRVRWVNHTFAYMLEQTIYNSAEKVAYADPEALCDAVKVVNTEQKIFKGQIGLRDIKRCIDSAKELSFEVEY